MKARPLIYSASIYSIATGKEKQLVTFYIMNTSKNINGWGVSDKALTEALPTILNSNLDIVETYQPKGHNLKSLTVGKFVSFEKPNGYALATAEITDPKTWELLTAGTIGPISVIITAYSGECSKCGATLASPKLAEKHSCIKQGQAYLRLTSFKFDKVDFVDNPAYPQAGEIKVGAETETVIQPIIYCASVYESQSFDKKEQKKLSEEIPTIEQLAEKIAAIEKTLETLTAQDEPEKDAHGCLIGKEQWDEETQKCVPISAPPAASAEAKKIARLENDLQKITDERHVAAVTAAAQARFTAGLAPKLEDEIKRLSSFNDEQLGIFAADANSVATKLQAAKQRTKPTIQYDGKDGKTLEAAIDETRARLGFPLKTKERS